MERRRSGVGDSDTVAAVTLSQMVDMAFGRPEVGIVLFNILKSLLHAILQTLGISDVEALYGVVPVTTAELTDGAPTSPQNDIAPLDAMLRPKSSLNLPMLHIVMPAPATFELLPTPGTPFHEMADKVKKLEVRFERLYRAPSNEELLNDTGGVNHVGEDTVTGMWQNMKLMGKVDAYAEGMKEVMALINNLSQETTKHWDETQSVKEQVDDVSRIINTEMEVPSFVTWSSLEEILKGAESPTQKPCGPSTALMQHMKTTGKVDQDVKVLDGKVQVLNNAKVDDLYRIISETCSEERPPDKFYVIYAGPSSMTSYCQSVLSAGKFKFYCPSVDKTGKGNCEREWDYFLVRHVACLSQDEIKEFDKKISDNYLQKADGFQTCPGCSAWCYKGDNKGNYVHCALCNKSFCWACTKDWVSPSKRQSCGNSDCDGRDERTRILAKCATKKIKGCQSCPTLRACPGCGILTAHDDDACAHVTCLSCGHSFCFICLKGKINKIFWPCSYLGTCALAARQTSTSWRSPAGQTSAPAVQISKPPSQDESSQCTIL